MNCTDLIRQGAAHAGLFIPSAILLGALHGLEPGHSTAAANVGYLPIVLKKSLLLPT